MDDHSSTVEIPHEIQTHKDLIPIYGHHHTICVKQDGIWGDINTWDDDRVPDKIDTVCVPEGLNLYISGEAHCLDIVVAGTLTLTNNWKIKVRTITVLPTGKLNIDSAGECTFLDIPLDTIEDPFQFGNGLIVIDGAVLAKMNVIKPTYAKVVAEMYVGNTQIYLDSEPNWSVGDTLIIPDTRHKITGGLSDEVEKVTITAINGHIVDITPLQFNHFGYTGSDGQVKELFHIGNLNQPIVFKSENPDGTRGHILFTQHADIDIESVYIKELGRTRAIDLLNSTVKNADGTHTVGTNQIGRYACHFHHCVGRLNNGKPYQFKFNNSVIEGSPKWGVVIHGTHYGEVKNNFIYDCAGAHIVTEDPLIWGNDISDNLIVAKRLGSGQRITERSGRNVPSGDHWHDRVGLGLESAMNRIVGNMIYDCKEGIGMAGFGTTMLWYPKVRGVHIIKPTDDTRAQILAGHMGYKPQEPKRYPFLFDTSNNMIWGGHRGIETWTADSYENWPEKMFPYLKIINTKIPTDMEDQQETMFWNWKILGDFKKLTTLWSEYKYAIFFKPGYRFGIKLFNCELRGYDVAYNCVDDTDYLHFHNCVFECPIITYLPQGRKTRFGPNDNIWKNCQFIKVNDKIVFIGGQYPKYDLSLWMKPKDTDGVSTNKVTSLIDPWIDGRKLKVYHYEQHKNWAHKSGPPPSGMSYGTWPTGLHTQAQLADAGTPIYGEVIPDWAFQAPEFGLFYAATEEPPIPVVNFSIHKQTVQFNNKTIGATSYLWDFGDGTTSTEVNPVHEFEFGIYSVTLTATNQYSIFSSQTITINIE